MKHIAKYYAWLDISENPPIETKLLVLDNCCFNALLYACEVCVGDVSYIGSRLSTLETKLLKRILNVKKGTSNTITFHELRRANIVSKVKDRQFQFFQKIMGFCEHDTVDVASLIITLIWVERTVITIFEM